MPGRTYCCNSPGYGTHLNSVVRSLKTAAGPSLDWAVKLLFFLAVLALYVWQMSSWDEIERQKCICTEVCVIEGIRITIANMDDSISVSICWYCFNILCMPQRVYCTPLIQITKQKAYMKACSWLSAPVDKDVELVYIMIGDSTRHVSTWRCVEKSLRSDVNDLRTWVPECALTPEHEVGPVSMVGDVMISRSRLLVIKSHFTNVYVSLDIIYNLSCISTSDFMFFLIQRSFGWVLRSFQLLDFAMKHHSNCHSFTTGGPWNPFDGGDSIHCTVAMRIQCCTNSGGRIHSAPKLRQWTKKIRCLLMVLDCT